MLEILLYVSTGLIIFPYVCYFVMIFLGWSKEISGSDGFNVTKDIISEYNCINVIESTGYFTIYNIKRKVIKLATKSYYGKDLSSISLSLLEAGISVVDSKKNVYISYLKKLFLNLKVLYIFPIIAIFINNFSFSISDAKVGIIFVGIFVFMSYVLINIKGEAILWINDNITKIEEITNDNRKKTLNFINKLFVLDKMIYFGELVMIVRFMFILFKIN